MAGGNQVKLFWILWTTRTLWLVGLILCFGFAGLCLFCRFANPQTHKAVYLFQAEIWPGIHPDMGESYSGVWRVWYRNGQLMSEGYWSEGSLDGALRRWYPDGSRWFECRYESGKEQGRCLEWDREGRLIASGVFDDGVPKEGTFFTHYGEGGGRVIERYKDGQRVSEDNLKD